MAQQEFTCFEQPLNEHVRTLLRLEHLFAETLHHDQSESEWGRRAAMRIFLDILAIMTRHDLRLEVGNQLANQHTTLQRFREHDDIDHRRLDDVLQQLETLGRAVQAIPTHFASYLLRDNELLNTVNNRSAIPGGTCGFDLPSYHYWLNLPGQTQTRQMQQWFKQLQPLNDSVTLLLSLIRNSAKPEPARADGGMLVCKPQSDIQLIQVFVKKQQQVYPEISASKHRFTIRFMEPRGEDLTASQAERDIDFDMACCQI